MNTYFDGYLGKEDIKNRIHEILKIHKIKHLSVYPDITPKKIEVAKKNFNVPDGETPLALYDSTSFGSGDSGVFFGTNGLYWKNDYLPERPGSDFISYGDLIKSDIKRKNIYEAVFSSGGSEKFILAYIGEQTTPSKELLHLLNLLKYGLTTFLETPVQELIEKMKTDIVLPDSKGNFYEHLFVDRLLKYFAWVVAAIIIFFLYKWIANN